MAKEFIDRFEYLPSSNDFQTFTASSGKSKSDFVLMNSVAFVIRNLSIIDLSYRTSIAQKYLLKSHIEFRFKDTHDLLFTVNCQNAVKSMCFEATSNESIHWRKSMPAIWSILYDYYSRIGDLSEEELASKGNTLSWRHVRGMVENFINSRSKYHIRHLSNAEVQTVTRKVLIHRLTNLNQEVARTMKKDRWILNELSLNDKKMICEKMCLDNTITIPEGKTFTQMLYNLLIAFQLPDNFSMTIIDFENSMLDLSASDVEDTNQSLYQWMYAATQFNNTH